MNRILFGDFAVKLVAVVTVFSGIAFAQAALKPAVASHELWSEDSHDRFYRHCRAELMRTNLRLAPDAIHLAYCDCRISEAERWLEPSDVTFILAATDGESNAELEARVLALPRSESKASEKRMRQYTQSSSIVCVRVLRETASKIMHSR